MDLIKGKTGGRFLMWFFILFLSSILFTACNRGENGGGGSPQETSEQENTWEKMLWDQGRWG